MPNTKQFQEIECITAYQPAARYVLFQPHPPYESINERPIPHLDSLTALRLSPWLPSYIELLYKLPSEVTITSKPVFSCFINPTLLTLDRLRFSTEYPASKRDAILDEMVSRNVDYVLHLNGARPGDGFRFYDRDRDQIKFLGSLGSLR